MLIAVMFSNSTDEKYPDSICIPSVGVVSHQTISDLVMSTFVALNASFAKTYPINDGEFSPCFGRHEEDIYDGIAFFGGQPLVPYDPRRRGVFIFHYSAYLEPHDESRVQSISRFLQIVHGSVQRRNLPRSSRTRE